MVLAKCHKREMVAGYWVFCRNVCIDDCSSFGQDSSCSILGCCSNCTWRRHARCRGIRWRNLPLETNSPIDAQSWARFSREQSLSCWHGSTSELPLLPIAVRSDSPRPPFNVRTNTDVTLPSELSSQVPSKGQLSSRTTGPLLSCCQWAARDLATRRRGDKCTWLGEMTGRVRAGFWRHGAPSGEQRAIFRLAPRARQSHVTRACLVCGRAMMISFQSARSTKHRSESRKCARYASFRFD